MCVNILPSSVTLEQFRRKNAKNQLLDNALFVEQEGKHKQETKDPSISPSKLNSIGSLSTNGVSDQPKTISPDLVYPTLSNGDCVTTQSSNCGPPINLPPQSPPQPRKRWWRSLELWKRLMILCFAWVTSTATFWSINLSGKRVHCSEC